MTSKKSPVNLFLILLLLVRLGFFVAQFIIFLCKHSSTKPTESNHFLLSPV